MIDASARALGRKIAFHRAQRGLSQRDFGAMIERSEAWVSQVERGARRIDRMTILRRVADALGVPLSELAAETPVIAAVTKRSEPVDALRIFLSSSPRFGLPTDAAEAGDSHGEHNLLDLVWELTHAGDYDALVPLLASLIPRLEASTRQVDEAARQQAYFDLARAYHACAAALSKLRQTDAAWVAADRAIAAAEHAGDLILMAEGAFRLTLVFQADRRHDQASETARSAIAALQSLVEQGVSAAIAVQGALRLQLATTAARQSDHETVHEQLQLARQAATALGADRNDYNTEFGPTNVGLHEVAIAVELGDAGTALRLASTIDASKLSPERQARFQIDLARAHLQRRKYDAVISSLGKAAALSSQQVRQHRVVREIVNDLVRAGYRNDPRLRQLMMPSATQASGASSG